MSSTCRSLRTSRRGKGRAPRDGMMGDQVAPEAVEVHVHTGQPDVKYQSARKVDPGSASNLGSDSILRRFSSLGGVLHDGMITMKRALRASDLLPPGFAVRSAVTEGTVTTIFIASASTSSSCPVCGEASAPVHSRYVRKVADLPLAGRSVCLRATLRRFWCEAVRCGRRIFAERFSDGTLAPLARRTGRLDGLVRHLGLALGRPKARSPSSSSSSGRCTAAVKSTSCKLA